MARMLRVRGVTYTDAPFAFRKYRNVVDGEKKATEVFARIRASRLVFHSRASREWKRRHVRVNPFAARLCRVKDAFSPRLDRCLTCRARGPQSYHQASNLGSCPRQIYENIPFRIFPKFSTVPDRRKSTNVPITHLNLPIRITIFIFIH